MEISDIPPRDSFWVDLRSMTHLTSLTLLLPVKPPIGFWRTLECLTLLKKLSVSWAAEEDGMIPMVWSHLNQLTALILPTAILDHDATEALANLPLLEALTVEGFRVRGRAIACTRPCSWQRLHLRNLFPLEDILCLPLRDGVKVTVEICGRTIQLFPDDGRVPLGLDVERFTEQMRVLAGCLEDVYLVALDGTPEPVKGTLFLSHDGILPSGLITAMTPLFALGIFDSVEWAAEMDGPTAAELVVAFPTLQRIQFVLCRVAAAVWKELLGLEGLMSVKVDLLLFSSLVVGNESEEDFVFALKTLASARRGRTAFTFSVRYSARDRKRAKELNEELEVLYNCNDIGGL